MVSDFTPLFIADVKPILSFRYYGVPGTVFSFFVASFIGITGYAHYILFKRYKTSEGQRRNQIGYLFLGSIIAFVGGATNFLPNFGIQIFPFGFYLISAYVGLLSYAIVKHNLMDIHIVFKKGTTYILLTILLFVPSFLLVILSQKVFFR